MNCWRVRPPHVVDNWLRNSKHLLVESAGAEPNAHVVLWYTDLDQRLVGHARQVGLKGGLHGSTGRRFQRNHQRVGAPASFKG